ncbi:UvrB/UvrC motif-containing protein [bacterium]|nr:UvrB/UvrC motif-containing protein [bacterium]
MSEKLICKFCGTTYENFQKTKRVGCENCYFEFRNTNELKNVTKTIRDDANDFDNSTEQIFEEVQALINQLKNNPKISTLNFKREKNYLTKSEETDFLKLLLQSAINLENYEEAAKIRDLLKKK